MNVVVLKQATEMLQTCSYVILKDKVIKRLNFLFLQCPTRSYRKCGFLLT